MPAKDILSWVIMRNRSIVLAFDTHTDSHKSEKNAGVWKILKSRPLGFFARNEDDKKYIERNGE